MEKRDGPFLSLEFAHVYARPKNDASLDYYEVFKPLFIIERVLWINIVKTFFGLKKFFEFNELAHK